MYSNVNVLIQRCQDTEGFLDEWEWGCEVWWGTDCQDPPRNWGYSEEGMSTPKFCCNVSHKIKFLIVDIGVFLLVLI